jgi:hypothetical protein
MRDYFDNPNKKIITWLSKKETVKHLKNFL